MPPTILNHFAGVTTARDRASIPEIKARRLVWATGGNAKTGLGMAPRRVERTSAGDEMTPSSSMSARPREMQWDEGRKRWPGLWERLGGPIDPVELEELQASQGLPHGSSDDGNTTSGGDVDSDDKTFAMRSFLPAQETVHHPSLLSEGPSSRTGMNTTMDRKRFGAFLRSLEEEQEAMDAVDARRREREFDRAEAARKEEFEDSDEEDGTGDVRTGNGTLSPDADTSEVIEAFERRLLELFIDGLDTIPYEPIDFADPATVTPNRLTTQDAEDAYFDDQEEEEAPPLREATGRGNEEDTTDGLKEGEYDY